MIAIIGFIVLIAGGVGGGFWIARNRSGGRGWRLLAMWLCVPFVLLVLWLVGMAITQGFDADALTGEMATSLGIVFVLFFALPWFIANFVGALVGRGMRRRSATGANEVFN